MNYLIAGLGNPGIEYENTRHNIGFLVLDALAKASNTFFEQKHNGLIARFRKKDNNIILLKPTTYMNLSGDAVSFWLKKEKIDIKNLLIVLDDINLPLGKIRIRAKGSDGGHNGLADICNKINTCKFARLRFGIDKNFPPGYQAEYVLGKWTAEEQKIIDERIPVAVNAIMSFILFGVQKAMSQFNSK